MIDSQYRSVDIFVQVTFLGQGIGNSVIQAKILIRYAPEVQCCFRDTRSAPTFAHLFEIFHLLKWTMGHLLVQGDYGLLDCVEMVPVSFHRCCGHPLDDLPAVGRDSR
jgi:hypothetical protein